LPASARRIATTHPAEPAPTTTYSAFITGLLAPTFQPEQTIAITLTAMAILLAHHLMTEDDN
jgi:hypothetical protein